MEKHLEEIAQEAADKLHGEPPATAREWTPKSLAKIVDIRAKIGESAHDYRLRYLQTVCDAHNAALAERINAIQLISGEVKRLEQQLAAEREKLKSYVESVNHADRHNAKWQERAEKAEQQLLAAQAAIDAEVHKPLVDAIIGLSSWLKASLDCKQHVWEPDQRAAAQETIDDALAKVKQ